MLFKGTNVRGYDTSEKISESFDEMGAYFNAHTDRMVTCYTVKCSSDNIEKSIEILSYMLFQSTFDPSIAFDQEKKVVIQELLRSIDNTEEHINDKIHELVFSLEPESDQERENLYPDNSIDNKKNIYRVGKPIGGYVDIFKNIKYLDTKCFWRNFYVPENIVVSICSDIDISKIKKYVRRYFGKITSDALICGSESGDKSYPAYYPLDDNELADQSQQCLRKTNTDNEDCNTLKVIDTLNKSCMDSANADSDDCSCTPITETFFSKKRPVFIMKKNTEQNHIAIAFRTTNIYCDDRLCLDLLDIILAGNMSSRLFIALREKEDSRHIMLQLITVNMLLREFFVYKPVVEMVAMVVIIIQLRQLEL